MWRSAPEVSDAAIEAAARALALRYTDNPAAPPEVTCTLPVLEKAQLWAPIEAKTIGAQTVRQALDYVARGEVDAGFVYATDASLMSDRVRVAFVVPTDTPVRYPIAVVAASTSPSDAQQFVAFVRAANGQAILRRFGFGQP